MLDVFEQWSTRDVGKVSERLIDSVLHTLIYGRAPMCCYCDRCANAHVLEWNGDLYVCDHFVYKEWKVGNIMERPLAELVQDKMLDDFALLKSELPNACRECEFLDFCKGGCPKHHKPIGASPERLNHFCQGHKAFFREALPVLANMAEYFKRGEMPPLVPPRKLTKKQAAAAEKKSADFEAGPAQAAPRGPAGGKAPGRNDPCSCGSGRKFKNCCGRE